MDQEGTDRDAILQELRHRLDENCVVFGPEAEGENREDFLDEISMCRESCMEEYLENGEISVVSIGETIAARQVFPCYFGSALKLYGVQDFLQGISTYTLFPEYPEEFGARVFKIARDSAGARLTYLKVTGGGISLRGPNSLLRKASSPTTEWNLLWEQSL
jgi:translation elongation factor EF-G